MTETVEKEVKVIDNTQWKERHQFVLSANGNIICQRYFKVNGFNPNALHSVELYETVRNAVRLIKNDLVSKSRIYAAITMRNSTKLTGFYNGEELSVGDACLAYGGEADGKVELSNGTVLDKTYLYAETVEDNNEEEDTTFVFKFQYLFDDKVVYEEQWDGTVYPKFIRNSVDLSNSNASYKYADPMRMTFSQQMTKSLTEGRVDLIYTIIKMFCNTLSNEVDENGNSVDKNYTKTFRFENEGDGDDKVYWLDSYPHEWANAVRQKTIRYKRWVEWDIPQSKLDYIDKHL